MNLKLFLVLLICAVAMSTRSAGQAISSADLQVLIITDERKFNRTAFFEMFDGFDGLVWTEVKHPEALDLICSDSIGKFDALVFYDMPENVVLSDEQKQCIQKRFQNGVPALFLHHSLLSYREWGEFREIVGGRFYNKKPLISISGDTMQSTYQHDVSYRIHVADKGHPVTQGVSDFEIFDETYNHYFVREDVHVLLTSDHPLSGEVVGWVNSYGNSEIVYLLNGHSETAYHNPHYRKLVLNAIRWLASKNSLRD